MAAFPEERPKRVVVCGGGVIGVCTAYFLSKKGAAVTLIEQSSIACAASGKAGGFLTLDWLDGGPVSGLARASFDLHRSLAEELDGPNSYGYRPLTTLSVTISESDKKSGPSSSNLPGWVDGLARSPRPIGTNQTTAQVHPQMFTRTLMAMAVDRYEVELVVGKADRVVEDGVGGRAHSIVLEPRYPDAISPHALFLNYFSAHAGKPMDPEVYPRPTGEVYICGMSAEEEVPNDPEEVRPNPESIAVLKRVGRNVSSHLREGEGGGRVKVEQACFLPCTDDGLPVIGELPWGAVRGCYVATGHSCWGILNGPATGASLADLILDGVSASVDLTPFSPSRFAVTST
ncbi:hypothetical protein V2J09_016680 [Rumex salicifolius]